MNWINDVLSVLSTRNAPINKKVKKPVPTNSILTLYPYKSYGTWVFDDAATGLVREAFVQGIPEILEKALEDAGIPLDEAEDGCSLVFSKNKFPDAAVVLTRLDGDKYNQTLEGNWYESQDGLKGWLCPALFCYFQEAPEKIYCKVGCKPKKK